MKHLLHDFDDEECGRTLRSVRRAVKPGGRLFICGFVIPDDDDAHFGKLFDVHMLVVTTGRERTVAEYTALLEAADLRFVAFHGSKLSPIGVIEATVD